MSIEKNNSYNLLSKILHWVTALLIFGLLFIGFYMGDIEPDSAKYKVYALHKSFGILVLILACVRVVWHIIKRRPEPISTHKPIEKIISKASALIIYAALFIIPLSGWAISSSGGHPVKLFGVKLPALMSKDKGMHELFEELHEISAIILFFIIGLHILGAFKHHFIDKDDTLKRMTAKSLGLVGGVVILLLTVVTYAPSGIFIAEEVIEEFTEEEDNEHGEDHDKHKEDHSDSKNDDHH